MAKIGFATDQSLLGAAIAARFVEGLLNIDIQASIAVIALLERRIVARKLELMLLQHNPVIGPRHVRNQYDHKQCGHILGHPRHLAKIPHA
ncbi:MAG: hypothetical protein ACI9OO_000261 [Bacteroidia bacterium]|jgi:hypothetical protein